MSLTIFSSVNVWFSCSIISKVRDVCYRPPGTQVNILNGVNFSLREKRYSNPAVSLCHYLLGCPLEAFNVSFHELYLLEVPSKESFVCFDSFLQLWLDFWQEWER